MKWVRLVAVLGLLAMAASGAVYLWFARAVEGPGPLQASVTVIVAPGAGVSAIARQMVVAGIADRPWMMVLEARRSGQDRHLKPGEYRFDPGVSIAGVLGKLVTHEVVARFVTIPEGLVAAEIRQILRGAEGLTGELTSPILDGDLLPETYRYEWGDHREDVVARMRAAKAAAVRELWAARASDLPLNSPQEAVVLASIVEKETGLASERAQVAAVFTNRLRRGMKLQSDPTVLYGLSRAGDRGGLTIADLERPTPFNTYVISGLPPSPICSPGRAALAAVLNPAISVDLYFVADGTGGHAFAATLEGHNRNVARWRDIQRQNDLR
ncbi:MAG: endolytic transglycosylase MltG [Rhodospirillaceae bacterium]|nr:endolytic transglycosylase MltG [Rhodospirillaceae bacterium]